MLSTEPSAQPSLGDLAALGDRARLVDELCTRYRTQPASALTLLAELSRMLGFLPEAVIAYVAARLDRSAPELSALAKAHELTSLTGEAAIDAEQHRLAVCGAGPCAARGGSEVERILAEKNLPFEPVGCQGACDLGPIACYNRGAPLPISAARARSLAKVSPGEWEDVLSVEKPVHAFKTDVMVAFANIFAKGSHQLATAKRHGVYAPLEAALQQPPEKIYQALLKSGLVGLDGKEVAPQFDAVRRASGEKVLVIDALEGESGLFKDRIILERDPHLLLAGAVMAAYAIGATEIFLVVRREYELALERTRAAVEEALRSGYLGDKVKDSPLSVKMYVRLSAALRSGDRPGILAALEGTLSRKDPAAGLYGKPTLVTDVETLSLLPAIVEKGAEWFRGLGVDGAHGVKLFSLSGDVKRPGNYELQRGTPLRTLIDAHGGGPLQGKTITAALIGGAGGGLIPPAHFDVPLDEAALKRDGATLGNGAVVLATEKTCLVDLVRREAIFAARDSIGVGQQGAVELKAIAEAAPETAEAQLAALSARGVARPLIASLNEGFKDAVREHREGLCTCSPKRARR